MSENDFFSLFPSFLFWAKFFFYGEVLFCMLLLIYSHLSIWVNKLGKRRSFVLWADLLEWLAVGKVDLAGTPEESLSFGKCDWFVELSLIEQDWLESFVQWRLEICCFVY